MSVQFTHKEFRKVKPWTGEEILAIIQSNDLKDYDLYEVKREPTEYINGLAPMNQWTYVVKFRRLEK